jgi:hypothetical protein
MRTYSRKISLYGVMARRYGKMLGKGSYWHLDQGPGRYFVPGESLGYYNDLSGKARWEGPVDESGFPLNRAADGKRVRHPISLFQKALGHWDVWLGSERRDEKHRIEFLRLAQWARDTQDESGGWETWPVLGLKRASPYSAMTQGEGISVLTRAFSITEEEDYRWCARRALGSMLTPVGSRGTSRWVPEGLVLEEVPFEPPKTILNGWIFALYGLYDLRTLDDGQDEREALDATLSALVAHMRGYDAGFWSYYDTSGSLASPFYHRLHIAQLKALERTFPEHAHDFATLREAFEEQLASRLNLTIALALKTYQKLRNPPEALTP